MKVGRASHLRPSGSIYTAEQASLPVCRRISRRTVLLFVVFLSCFSGLFIPHGISSADPGPVSGPFVFCDPTLSGVVADIGAQVGSQLNVAREGSTQCWSYFGSIDTSSTYFVLSGSLQSGPSGAFFAQQYFNHSPHQTITIVVSQLKSSFPGCDIPPFSCGYDNVLNISSVNGVLFNGSIVGTKTFTFDLGNMPASGPDGIKIQGNDVAILSATLNSVATPTVTGTPPTPTPTPGTVISCGYITHCDMAGLAQAGGPGWTTNNHPNCADYATYDFQAAPPYYYALTESACSITNATSPISGVAGSEVLLVYLYVNTTYHEPEVGFNGNSAHWPIDSVMTNLADGAGFGSLSAPCLAYRTLYSPPASVVLSGGAVGGTFKWTCATLPVGSNPPYADFGMDGVSGAGNVVISPTMYIVDSSSGAIMGGGPPTPTPTSTFIAAVPSFTPNSCPTMPGGVLGTPIGGQSCAYQFPTPTGSPTTPTPCPTAAPNIQPMQTNAGCIYDFTQPNATTPPVQPDQTPLPPPSTTLCNGGINIVVPASNGLPSWLQNLWVIGGIASSTVDLVNGVGQLITQLFIPQHIQCDIGPLINTMQGHIHIPKMDISQVISATTQTCQFFGINGSISSGIMSSGPISISAGVDGCSHPWLDVFGIVKTLISFGSIAWFIAFLWSFANDLFTK